MAPKSTGSRAGMQVDVPTTRTPGPTVAQETEARPRPPAADRSKRVPRRSLRALIFARAAHVLIADNPGDLDQHPPAIADSYTRVERPVGETGDHDGAADLLLELIEEASNETRTTSLSYPYLLMHGLCHALQAGWRWEAAERFLEAELMLRERLEEGDWILHMLDVMNGEASFESLQEELERGEI